MAASILTDSSDYSEDFESSSEAQEYSESQVFPRLFDYLESSLANNAYINYKTEETPKELAVGFFLNKIPNSKQDILDKLD